MEHRTLGRTGREVSVVGLGTWQLGADWGDVSEADASAVLEASAEAGVTFFDTADVYGDGRSEQLVGRFVAAHPDAGFTVATKMGRRAEQVPASYVEQNFRAVARPLPSQPRRGHDRPGPAALPAERGHRRRRDVRRPRPRSSTTASIAAYGVSVETAAQALSAIARPHVASVQIILNAFRMKPLDEVLPAAASAGVGIIARVPLASGLLSGTYDLDTTFAADDHRTYNRDGSAFDVGETFSGVDYETGVAAAREFSALVVRRRGWTSRRRRPPSRGSWQQPGVSTVIPGARNVDQARANAAAGLVGELPPAFLDGVADLYDRRIRDAGPRSLVSAVAATIRS